MIILDTDHISALQYRETPKAFALHARLETFSPEEIATTVITVEEQMRGWLGLLRRYSDVHRQVAYYERLVKLFDFFAEWRILPFDQGAATEFQRLRQQGVRKRACLCSSSSCRRNEGQRNPEERPQESRILLRSIQGGLTLRTSHSAPIGSRISPMTRIFPLCAPINVGA